MEYYVMMYSESVIQKNTRALRTVTPGTGNTAVIQYSKIRKLTMNARKEPVVGVISVVLVD
jgi:hypothetical protein